MKIYFFTSVFSLVKTLILILRESFSVMRRKGFIMGFDWFVLRFGLSIGLIINYKKSNSHNKILTQLHSEGYSFLEKIPKNTISELIDFFLKNSCQEEINSLSKYNSFFRSKKIMRPKGILAKGTDECLISKFANSQDMVSLVTEFLGVPLNEIEFYGIIDSLIYLEDACAKKGNSWIQGDEDKVEFHRDIDARKFVKLFVYLNDVIEGGGHHEFYVNTHKFRPTTLSVPKRFMSDKIEKECSENNDVKLVKITGVSGTCFIENTFGFHRATVPKINIDGRLMMTIIYYDSKSARHYDDFH